MSEVTLWARVSWIPRWHWGIAYPAETGPRMRFYGLHWGWLTIGRWLLVFPGGVQTHALCSDQER